MINNDGGKIIRAGQANGVVVGGNLSTFHSLKGTPYMPSLDNTILFLEDDNVVDDITPVEFDRNLTVYFTSARVYWRTWTSSRPISKIM